MSSGAEDLGLDPPFLDLVVISAPPSNRTLHFKHSITVNYLQKTTEQHLPWLMRSLHEDVVRILKKGKK